MPLISIIVPIYNVEEYLGDCVESILNQTFRDFVLILVDDGSTDNSPLICDDYSKRDNRIIVIHKKNGGVSSARNAGIDYSFSKTNCKFIAFIDPDDWVDDGYLAVLIDNIGDADACICGYQKFGLENFVPGDNCTNCVVDSIGYWKFNADFFISETVWAKLFRIFLFTKIRFPLDRIHEDSLVIHRIMGTCKKIRIVSAPYYHYRIRENSIMSNTSFESLTYKKTLCDFYIDRAFYFKNSSIDLSKKYYSLALDVISKNYYKNIRLFREDFKLLKRYYKSTKAIGFKTSYKIKMFFAFPFFYSLLKNYL